jgi:hypothetical protein
VLSGADGGVSYGVQWVSNACSSTVNKSQLNLPCVLHYNFVLHLSFYVKLCLQYSNSATAASIVNLRSLILSGVGDARAAQQEEQGDARHQKQQHRRWDIVFLGDDLLEEAHDIHFVLVPVRAEGKVPKEHRLGHVCEDQAQPRSNGATAHSPTDTQEAEEQGERHNNQVRRPVFNEGGRVHFQCLDGRVIMQNLRLDDHPELKKSQK